MKERISLLASRGSVPYRASPLSPSKHVAFPRAAKVGLKGARRHLAQPPQADTHIPNKRFTIYRFERAPGVPSTHYAVCFGFLDFAEARRDDSFRKRYPGFADSLGASSPRKGDLPPRLTH